MNLLKKIQDAAIDSDRPVSELLRNCKVLASRLGHKEFQLWVDRELSGYDDSRELPPYRKQRVHSYGHFVGAFGREMKNAPIPIQCMPESLRKLAENISLRGPVSEYEDLCKRSVSDSPIQRPWPTEVTAFFAEQMYQGMACIAAWQILPRSTLAAVLDTVRNKVLDFALAIEQENPDAGNVGQDTSILLESRVASIFNTTIIGGTNVVAGAVNTVSAFTVIAGDRESLLTSLKGLGVETGDLDELNAALDEDENPKEQGHFGSRVSAWLGRMATKAASGAWDKTVSVGLDRLVRYLNAFYGLSQL